MRGKTEPVYSAIARVTNITSKPRRDCTSFRELPQKLGKCPYVIGAGVWGAPRYDSFPRPKARGPGGKANEDF